MGYKIYGEDEPKRSRLTEFIEWFVVTLLLFPYVIGGWLVHWGMPVIWMLAIAAMIATIFGWKFSSPNKK